MSDWFDTIFVKQKNLQKQFVEEREIPSTTEMYNAATAAMVEIGEMLQSDKRWKKSVHHLNRPLKYDKAEFVNEYADVMIYMMNVAIYAGLDIEEVKEAIFKKQLINIERFKSSGMLKETK